MMILRTPAPVFLLSLLPLATQAQDQSQSQTPAKPEPGTHERELAHGGLTRTYRIHVPASYDGSKPVPLILAFHGGGGTSLSAERGYGFNPLSEKHGFLVVYPQGVENHWNDGRTGARFPNATTIDDVGFIRALIADLRKTYAIDPARIDSTGLSNGGFFSQRLGWELSDTLAAIAPAAGTLDPDIALNFAPASPVHVLEFHGTRDAAVPYEGGEVSAKGGKCIAVPAMVALWVKANGCQEPPRVEDLPDRDPDDGTKVQRTTYAPGPKGAEVILYTIEGHGHVWPGRQPANPEAAGRGTRELEAAPLIWDFFAQHPKCKP